jgi:hypothetical protein
MTTPDLPPVSDSARIYALEALAVHVSGMVSAVFGEMRDRLGGDAESAPNLTFALQELERLTDLVKTLGATDGSTASS